MVYTHVVVKENKRLFIKRFETGEVVYTPPDFIRPHIRSRAQLKALADRLTAGGDYITEVVAFQASLYPPKSKQHKAKND